MALDGADFASWLIEQGTVPSYVTSYVEAAIGICETAPSLPVEPSYIDAFIARMGGEDVGDDRIEIFRRAGAALLRYQSTASSGRVTFSGLDQSTVDAAIAKPALPESAPYLSEGDIPIRPLPPSRPIPPDRYRESARRRRMVLSAIVVVLTVPAIFTIKATVDGFRYRSHAVTREFYSEHLHTEMRFPPDKGWRHLTGGDRQALYDDVLPRVPGVAADAEIATSAFYRGEDPSAPDFGLSIAVVPFSGKPGDVGLMESERMRLGETLSKLLSERMAIGGGTWSKRDCSADTVDVRRPVVCIGQVRRGRTTFAVDSWVLFGGDAIAIAIFRSPEPNEERRREASAIVAGIRL